MGKGDQARSEILRAARDLFLSKGYQATRMRDIATESGDRAVAGIYNHFPSKQAVFEALLADRMPGEQTLHVLEKVSGDDVRAYLRSLLSTILPLIAKNFDFIELIQIDFREFRGVHVRELLQNLIIPRALIIAQRVQSYPDLKPIDSFALLRFLVSFIGGFVLTQRYGPAVYLERYSEREWIERYVTLLAEGLCAPAQSTADERKKTDA